MKDIIEKHFATTSSDVALRFIELSNENIEDICKTKIIKMTYFAYAWYLVASDNKSRLYEDENINNINGSTPNSLYNNWENVLEEAKHGNRGDLKHYKIEELVKKIFSIYGSMDKNTIVEASRQDLAWLYAREDLTPFTIGDKPLEDDLIFTDYQQRINIK